MFACIILSLCWLCICCSVGWESQEVKGPIPRLWVNSRTPRNRVIHGKRVVLRHLAEHDITSSSNSDGVLSVHTSGVYRMIFLKGLFILRFSWPYPGLDDTREWGGIESFAGTDGDYGSVGLMDIYLWHAGILSVISISGFRLFQIPGLNVRILVQRIWLSSI